MPAMCPFPLAALVTLITLPSDHALHLGTCTCRRSSKHTWQVHLTKEQQAAGEVHGLGTMLPQSTGDAAASLGCASLGFPLIPPVPVPRQCPCLPLPCGWSLGSLKPCRACRRGDGGNIGASAAPLVHRVLQRPSAGIMLREPRPFQPCQG